MALEPSSQRDSYRYTVEYEEYWTRVHPWKTKFTRRTDQLTIAFDLLISG